MAVGSDFLHSQDNVSRGRTQVTFLSYTLPNIQKQAIFADLYLRECVRPFLLPAPITSSPALRGSAGGFPSFSALSGLMFLPTPH